jgi:ornithine--oxo-acid transaminase
MIDRLRAVRSPVLKEVRGRGLWAGVEIDPRFASAREICERLLTRGVRRRRRMAPLFASRHR